MMPTKSSGPPTTRGANKCAPLRGALGDLSNSSSRAFEKGGRLSDNRLQRNGAPSTCRRVKRSLSDRIAHILHLTFVGC
jgi:hypothetical protein